VVILCRHSSILYNGLTHPSPTGQIHIGTGKDSTHGQCAGLWPSWLVYGLQASWCWLGMDNRTDRQQERQGENIKQPLQAMPQQKQETELLWKIQDNDQIWKKMERPVNSRGHEDEMRSQKLLHERQRNSSSLIDTDKLSLTKLLMIRRMNVLPDTQTESHRLTDSHTNIT